jgi:hypothetical protein
MKLPPETLIVAVVDPCNSRIYPIVSAEGFYPIQRLQPVISSTWFCPKADWVTERVANSMIEWLHWPLQEWVNTVNDQQLNNSKTDWLSLLFSELLLLWANSSPSCFFEPKFALFSNSSLFVSQMGRSTGPKQWNLWTPFCRWVNQPALTPWIQGGVQIGNARLVEIAIAVGVKSGFGCGCLQVATNHQEGNVFLKRDSIHNCDMNFV